MIMNKKDHTFTVFEVVPLERLNLTKSHEHINNITHTLQKTGFELAEVSDKSPIIRFFKIQNKQSIQELLDKVITWEKELIWLFSEFFEYLYIYQTNHDLLFGLVSNHNPETISPEGRSAGYIASEVGNIPEYVYRPALPRIFITEALKQQGFTELSNSLKCSFILPSETALAAHLEFIKPPITYNIKLTDQDSGFEWHTLSLLSSKLLSQNIVELIRDESMLNHVEIAQVFPFQMFSIYTDEEQQPFHLLNHFSIKAQIGTFDEVLDELLGISLHLNWSIAKEHTGKLPREESLKYAFIQNTRLKQVERKEQQLVYSLNVLQKRYPTNSSIIEWEINNLYSNIVRFSPVYLHWKSHLQAFIDNQDDIGYGFSNFISRLDWNSLENKGIATIEDGKQIIELLKIAPASTLTKMRIITEKIVSFIFNKKFPDKSSRKTLAEKLQKLNELNVFPSFIGIYLNTLRLTGNIGAHEGSGTREDVEAILPIFLRVIEWFLDKEL